jgi:hypothetical protein
MADQEHIVLPEMINQPDNIPSEFTDVIITDSPGFIAEIIAALVRDNHTVALFSKEIDLAPPPVPELREAVQKDDHLSFFRPCQDHMQVDSVCFNKLIRI